MSLHAVRDALGEVLADPACEGVTLEAADFAVVEEDRGVSDGGVACGWRTARGREVKLPELATAAADRTGMECVEAGGALEVGYAPPLSELGSKPGSKGPRKRTEQRKPSEVGMRRGKGGGVIL